MKELTMFTLASNLITSLRTESARLQKAAVDRIGFLDEMAAPHPVAMVEQSGPT